MNETTCREWRELGFHCARDDAARAWTVRGSRDGLRKFGLLLRAHAGDPGRAALWEHRSLGPRWALEVMTGPAPRIDGCAIEGSPEDLAGLGELVEARLARIHPGGRLELGRGYAPAAGWSLELVVEADNFDPASADDEGRGVEG